MLAFLRIQGLAVFDEVSLELGPGLNVLTGETGAGKSVLVAALALLRGARANAELVRPGCSRARVEAQFLVDGVGGKDELVIARELSADPERPSKSRTSPSRKVRGRAFLQGELVPVARLAEVGAPLIDLCSQHEHHSLGQAARQLELLDAYAGLELSDYAAAYSAWNAAKRQLEERRRALAAGADRGELLRYQLAELERVAPQVTELEELQKRVKALQSQARWASLAQATRDELYEGEHAAVSTLTRLQHEAQAGVEALGGDSPMGSLAAALEQARSACEEATQLADDLERTLSSEPEELDQAEERLAQLLALKRKHGADPALVLETLQQELERFDDASAELANLQQRCDEALQRCRQLSATLSSRRSAAGPKLARAVEKELAGLELSKSRVVAALNPSSTFGPRGTDSLELLVSCNPGLPPGPLSSVASGGELSRVLLALKTVLAREDRSCLQVFDEVDAGVGGKVAEAVGARLWSMAHATPQAQVLCITHLPQIAAFADRHYHIKKTSKGQVTQTRARLLDEAQRIDELARMLGGAKVGESARAHARELLSAAHAPRKPGKKARRPARLAQAS